MYMYLDYVEADVLVEGEESDNSKTVVVPNSMNQEKLDQESKLREREWKNCQRCTHILICMNTHAIRNLIHAYNIITITPPQVRL